MSDLKNINEKYDLCINAVKTTVMIIDRVASSRSKDDNIDGYKVGKW